MFSLILTATCEADPWILLKILRFLSFHIFQHACVNHKPLKCLLSSFVTLGTAQSSPAKHSKWIGSWPDCIICVPKCSQVRLCSIPSWQTGKTGTDASMFLKGHHTTRNDLGEVTLFFTDCSPLVSFLTQESVQRLYICFPPEPSKLVCFRRCF